jgi:hypothetical protein
MLNDDDNILCIFELHGNVAKISLTDKTFLAISSSQKKEVLANINHSTFAGTIKHVIYCNN